MVGGKAAACGPGQQGLLAIYLAKTPDGTASIPPLPAALLGQVSILLPSLMAAMVYVFSGER